MSDIFISFKNTDHNGHPTQDFKIASDLQKFLCAKRADVFFSAHSLKEEACSDYKSQIDKELDDCKILIIIGTRAEFLTSEWVHYEWDTFLQDIISGVKPDGEIYCVLGDIPVKDIPRGLRYRQKFEPNYSGFVNLYDYITGKLANINREPGDVTYVCKHCGMRFSDKDRGICHYHSQQPVQFKTKKFDGNFETKWYYPCCCREVADDGFGHPKFLQGCKIGHHEK